MSKTDKIVFFIFVIILLLLFSFPHKIEKTKTYKLYNKSVLDPLYYNDSVSEEFVSDDNYNYIGLTYANYGKLIKNGDIVITIKNEKGKSKKRSVKLKSLFDNETFYIKYKLKKGRKYIITVTNNTRNGITFYTTEANIESSKLLDYDSKNKNLVLSFKKDSTDFKTLWYYFMLVAIYSSIKILNIGGKNEK